MDENTDFGKYEKHYDEEGFWHKMKNYSSKAGGKVIYTALKLFYALKSKDTPAWAKSVIAGALGYFILPADLVPDMVPVAGYTDDLGVLLAAIGTVAVHITDEVEAQARQRMSDWFGGGWLPNDESMPADAERRPLISVCIPIFNCDVRHLVSRLNEEADKAGCAVEIVCIDDGSDDSFVELNAEIEPMAKYVKLGENIGRARVRNLFLQYTSGLFLLFLDNDCKNIPERFVSRYEKSLGRDSEVIVGGHRYDNDSNDRNHRLRTLYGRRVEGNQPADKRNHDTYRSFMSNNFMIRRDIFERIRFDGRISGYGHEDTLFGYRLMQNDVKVLHIDNDVTNGNIDTNEEFVGKTRESVRNLVAIRRFLDDTGFDDTVKLLRTYRRLEKSRMTWAVLLVHKMTKRTFEKLFLAGRGTLTMFSFYKLGLLCEYSRQ